MSDRVASPHNRRPSFRPDQSRCGRWRLGGAAAVLLAIVLGWVAQADEPAATPLRPEPSTAPSAAKYKIPDTRTNFNFRGVKDNTPFVPETKNAQEAGAWSVVVGHAREFPTAELEQFGRRDFIYDDLFDAKSREEHRFALLRFDGRLLRIRKVPQEGLIAAQWTGPVYEGWLAPKDEPDSRALIVIFTDLPAGLPVPGDDGRSVPVNRWVSFAGYFFKLLAYPGDGADPARPNTENWRTAPLLIGRSVTPLDSPPADEIPLDKNLRAFGFIVDDAEESDRGESLEVAARDRILLHARKFPTEELERVASREAAPADLFVAARKNYQFSLLHVEGRLIWLRAVPADARLKASGIDTIYEGGLVPHNDRNGNPVRILFSELPEGLEPQPAGSSMMDRPVTFAGYSFKLARYTSRERDKDGNPIVRRAPLLIGRSVTLQPDNSGRTSAWWGQFGPAVTVGVILLAVTGLGLGWWLRRGDQTARREVESVRNRNPFAGPGDPEPDPNH